MKTIKYLIFPILIILFLIQAQTIFAGSQQISQTDASEVAQRARAYLNDPSRWGEDQKSIWSDSELLQWVNDGSLDIVTRTQCLEDIEIKTLVAGTTNYTLTTNYIAIKAVIYKASATEQYSLEKGNLYGRNLTGSFGWQESMTGPPAYWMQWESDVIVYPIPTSDEAGHIIDVYLIKRPPIVTENDDVQVPAIYDRALVLYVAAQAMYKDGQFTKSSRFMSEYLVELDRYRSDYVERLPKTYEGN